MAQRFGQVWRRLSSLVEAQGRQTAGKAQRVCFWEEVDEGGSDVVGEDMGVGWRRAPMGLPDRSEIVADSLPPAPHAVSRVSPHHHNMCGYHPIAVDDPFKHAVPMTRGDGMARPFHAHPMEQPPTGLWAWSSRYPRVANVIAGRRPASPKKNGVSVPLTQFPARQSNGPVDVATHDGTRGKASPVLCPSTGVRGVRPT